MYSIFFLKFVKKLMSEDKIWAKMLQGDKNSLELIYRQYVQSLFAYSIKLCQNKELAEDAIQNLFIDIWNKRNNLKNTENVKAYLFLSLRRRIYREIKKQNKITNTEIHEGTFLEVEDNRESRIIKDEETEIQDKKLKSAMQFLSKNQKEIIYLKFEINMSNQEIADLLNINNQSVRNSLHRAISKLKKLMILLFM